jgi:hypothetical protein
MYLQLLFESGGLLQNLLGFFLFAFGNILFGLFLHDIYFSFIFPDLVIILLYVDIKVVCNLFRLYLFVHSIFLFSFCFHLSLLFGSGAFAFLGSHI